MLDSGSSVSLLKQEIVANTPGIVAGQQEPGLRLISAAGVDIPILDHVKAEVTVGNLVKSHNFFVVKDLITPVILGTDFLQEHRLLLDFTTTPVTVVQSETQSQHIQQQADQPQAQEARSRLSTLWKAEQVFKIKKCSVAAIEVEDAEDKLHTMVVEDCAIPLFGKPGKYELLQFIKPGLAAVVY